MTNNIVETWFGDRFQELAPELQALHKNSGKLIGQVDVNYGHGIAGFIGKRLAKKLNIPAAGNHRLVVTISHDKGKLNWSRLFNETREMKSVFVPVGDLDNGYWIEKTGPLQIKLTVKIIDGGWHWQCLSFSIFGIRLPTKIFPESQAWKKIEDEKYRFYVGFKLWFFGDLLSYSGLLNLEKN